MYYVYFLRSLTFDNTYIGYTTNLAERLKVHNAGRSPHTSKFKPWKIVAYVAFDSEEKARSFEKYVKIGSGYAFAKKRFW